MEPLLRVEDLRTYFHTDEGTAKAVDGVSFGLAEQETLGVVGESGCGKSVTALSILLRFIGLESFGMSVNFGPLTALKVILFSLPLVPLGASLMTIVAAYTRSYREAQTYLGLVLLVPTIPLVFAGALGLQPTTALMATPSALTPPISEESGFCSVFAPMSCNCFVLAAM